MLSTEFTAAQSGWAFTSSLHSSDQAFASFVTSLRANLMTRLSYVLTAMHARGGVDERSLTILQGLENVLNDKRPERLYFKYEEAHPVALAHKKVCFHEALIEMKDGDGRPVPTGDVLSVVNKNAIDPTLGAAFRAWLAFEQIRDFYSHRSEHSRLSLNICPDDVDIAEFRDTISRGLALAQACDLPGIILEAVESKPWDLTRCRFLLEQQKYGVTLAIDDYGAPDGFNGEDTLIAFLKEAKEGCPLVVKLDGKIVRAFIDSNDKALIDRLQEIRRTSPNATVVAEWLNDAADTNRFLAKLKQHGLENQVHLVQGRDLRPGVRRFLRELLHCGRGNEGCGGAALAPT